jgi:hypothetical protein
MMAALLWSGRDRPEQVYITAQINFDQQAVLRRYRLGLVHTCTKSTTDPDGAGAWQR